MIPREKLPTEKFVIEPGDMAAVEAYDRGSKHFMSVMHRLLLRDLGRQMPGWKTLLDIGTGTGRMAMLAAGSGKDRLVTGIDISEEMLAKCRQNVREAGLEKMVKVVHASGETIPFPDEHFDAVVSYASLHHWENPVGVLDEIHRVLRKGGVCIIRDGFRFQRVLGWSAVKILSLAMNHRHRDNWPKAILAGYTVEETRQLVEGSKLNRAGVKRISLGFDVTIEYRKPDGIRKPERTVNASTREFIDQAKKQGRK
jgi:ubiquinone/menaquinone biosynthesis C-methylase UbiE